MEKFLKSFLLSFAFVLVADLGYAQGGGDNFSTECEEEVVSRGNLITSKEKKNLKTLQVNHPFHYAARTGNLKTVESCVGRDRDVNKKDSCYNLTPLEHAIIWEQYEIVQYFISVARNKQIKNMLEEAIKDKKNKLIACIFCFANDEQIKSLLKGAMDKKDWKLARKIVKFSCEARRQGLKQNNKNKK